MANPKRDPAVDEFIAEGKEILERVGRSLQLIERNQGVTTKDEVSALYRDMHTLKGTAQLFGYKPIGMVAHTMEASLDPIRKLGGAIPLRLIEACIKNVDLLDRMLKAVDQDIPLPEQSDEMTRAISELTEAATSVFNAEINLAKDVRVPAETAATSNSSQAAASPAAPAAPAPAVKSVVVETQPAVKLVEPAMSTAQPSSSVSSLPPADITASEVSASAPAGGSIPTTGGAESTIRVHVSLLDRVLNLVGELVLVRNQVVQRQQQIDDPEFSAVSKVLDVVTSDLQSEVMKTRMQPVETVLGKFHRLTREIAKDLGKRIDLTLEGSETELDRSLLEAVKDPLTHIVRNSCDHGIETIEERKKAGKPETGHLLIRSFHEGGQVVIEISDDGKGLNRKRIATKAIEKGILTQDQLVKMSDKEICELIFAPGFSTAEKVTSVSGRGVGMDVVKTNIEKIGGSVQLSSVEGKGTSLQLRIPLTLAIVPALLVKSLKDKFAIPQVKLVELVRVDSESRQGQIEYLQGRAMYRLRGSLLPLLDLCEITGEPKRENYDSGCFIVVLNADGERYGLIVNEILDTADIVVKPMSNFLKNLNVYSGATILGDGSVALILDVMGTGEYGKVLGKKAQNDDKELFARGEKRGVALDIQEFLFFDLGTDSTHSIPLCLVQRLEEFDEKVIEFSGQQRVARYRGALLPIISLKEALGYPNDPSKKGHDRVPVIVIQRSGLSFGLEVDDILDVATIDGAIDDSIRDRVGILGNIVHDEKVIVVVDGLGVIERMTPQLRKGAAGDAKSGAGAVIEASGGLDEVKNRLRDMKLKKVRVLYAEDVAFFRKHVSKVLNGAGIDVTTVEDGQKAIEELEAAPEGQYNLVLSDIEMPRMTGLELAAAIKKVEKLRNIPLIALTTRFRDTDVAAGKAAGFDIYLEKLNPEKLMEAVRTLMGDKNIGKDLGT